MNQRFKKTVFWVASLGILLTYGSAQAETLSGSLKEKTIDRMDQAINVVRTAKGKFVQTANGKKETGTFYINRPNRMRFEYDDQPLILLANGAFVVKLDTRLQNTAHKRLKSTPLYAFLRENASLRQGVVVTSVSREKGVYKASVYQEGNRDAGLLTLRFIENNQGQLRLNGWRATDQQGTVVTLIFPTYETAVRLSPDLFKVPAEYEE